MGQMDENKINKKNTHHSRVMCAREKNKMKIGVLKAPGIISPTQAGGQTPSLLSLIRGIIGYCEKREPKQTGDASFLSCDLSASIFPSVNGDHSPHLGDC